MKRLLSVIFDIASFIYPVILGNNPNLLKVWIKKKDIALILSAIIIINFLIIYCFNQSNNKKNQKFILTYFIETKILNF